MKLKMEYVRDEVDVKSVRIYWTTVSILENNLNCFTDGNYLIQFTRIKEHIQIVALFYIYSQNS